MSLERIPSHWLRSLFNSKEVKRDNDSPRILFMSYDVILGIIYARSPLDPQKTG